jgi:hypothetical protein
MPYKVIQVTKVPIVALTAKAKETVGRAPNPRDLELRNAINEALAAAESDAIQIKVKGEAKVATLRAAAARAVRGAGAKVFVSTHRSFPDSVFISRVPLSKRGRRPKQES